MHRSPTSRAASALALWAAFALSAALALPLHAQIGEAVAVHPTADGAAEVLVLRPRDRLDRPALVVYRLDGDGAWRPAARLAPAAPAAPYEGFSPSLSLGDAVIAAGAADADGEWAARLYRRGGSGWTGVGSIALVPTARGPTAGPAALDMATLSRNMQPPPAWWP